jgi:hypothetical protein
VDWLMHPCASGLQVTELVLVLQYVPFCMPGVVQPPGAAGHVQPADGKEPVQVLGLVQLAVPDVTRQPYVSYAQVATTPPRQTVPAPEQSPGGVGHPHEALPTAPEQVPTPQAVAIPHCPLLSHVWTCVVSEHFVFPGTHTPPQASPTHAFGQAVAGSHCPPPLQLCTCV